MAKIVKQFSKQLIPFSYKISDIDSFTNKTTSDGKNIWVSKKYNTNHIFDHIVKKQETCLTEGILRTLALNDSARSAFGLPGANSTILLSSRGKQSGKLLEIKLREISLSLFETHVAFLQFEWEYCNDAIDDCINANYFLSELKSKENVLLIKKGKDEYSELTLDNVVKNIFSMFDHTASFDRNEEISFYDLKPILFSAVLLDKKDEDFEYLSGHLAQNFKKSYMTETQDYCTMFVNSRWCGSETAMVSISHLTDNEQTNEFFLTQFMNIAKNNYFYLYLLTLNQKFTLMKRLSQIAKVNTRQVVASEQALKEQAGVVSALLGKAQLYETRCNFDCPSSMTHINTYYDYARSSQKVGAYEKEFERKIKALSQLLDTCRKQLDDYKEYHHTKVLLLIFLITQVIGSISLFKTSCDIVSAVCGFSVYENLTLLWFPILVTVLFMVGLGIQVVHKYRELKRQEVRLPKNTNKNDKSK